MINIFVGKDFTPAMIDEVNKDSPAYIAGLKKNDVIVSIDKNEVKSILDVSKFITLSTSELIDFKVLRYDQEISFKVKPDFVESEDSLGNKVKKRMSGKFELRIKATMVRKTLHAEIQPPINAPDAQMPIDLKDYIPGALEGLALPSWPSGPGRVPQNLYL